jgi:hypothetical protein
MIYDELKNLISITRSDNTVEIFDNAVLLFEAMGEDNYMQIFEATMGASPNLSDDELIGELIVDLHVIVDNLFMIQGIKLIDDTLISDKIKIARGLLSIFDYSDKAAIARILETDLNPEEIIAEILPLVCDIQTEEAFSLLAEVNEAVPGRLKALIIPQPDIEQEDPYGAAIQRIIASYGQFKEKILESKSFYTDRFLNSMDTIGLDYDTYLNELLKHKPFQDLLSYMDAAPKTGSVDVFDSVSKYLIGISILSIDGHDNYINTIKHHLTDITNNVSSLTRLESAISDNLIKLSRASNT